MRAWIASESHENHLSQNEFVLRVLQRAYSGQAPDRGQLLLFPQPPSDSRNEPDVAVPFSFIDLFAGIGGLRIALEAVGGKCRFSAEWDKHCQRTYKAWFGETPKGDIRRIKPSEIPDHDLLAAGFPCQPFSIAGVSKKNSLGRAHGFKDVTQGTLFFNLATIIEAKQPPVLLLENVKNLQSHDGGRTWSVIFSALTDLGYRVFAKVIDAAAWVPQHRERIFIVGFHRKIFGETPPFSFPEGPKRSAPKLRDILEEEPDAKYTLSDRLWEYLQKYAKRHRERGNGFGFGLIDPDGISRTLSARYFKDGSEILIPQGARRSPRRLTPRECARLMGFPECLPIVVSDTQAYKQFGNAVVPPVAEAVARQITKVLRWRVATHGNGCLLKSRRLRVLGEINGAVGERKRS
ncbi:MAG TPA: DNA (cytosine-5-)-methyltransferase [Terriglobia bacterium]|nr:DNA (cytosine-5-)-methyltransferase [Terriglobia bacterium]